MDLLVDGLGGLDGGRSSRRRLSRLGGGRRRSVVLLGNLGRVGRQVGRHLDLGEVVALLGEDGNHLADGDVLAAGGGDDLAEDALVLGLDVDGRLVRLLFGVSR